jgi:membrane-bound lytic murein transglycosylase
VTVTDRKIRLTKYLVYQVKGSVVKTDTYDTALYASPDDPAALAAYTRIDAYAGVFETGGAAEGLVQPLVYLTREGVNQALMQGTVEVALPNGDTKLFNVHRNNGIPWDPSVKDANRQRRYWTFREVQGVLGVEDIPLADHVAVAGDIYNIGLGKLVALVDDRDTLRLAVLADTGGAFQPNLFQLDWFAGAYPDHAAFAKGTAHLPLRARAMVLVAKP